MVEGHPLLTIPREVAEAERLRPGQPLDGALYAKLCRAADEEAAFRTGLRILGRRPFAERDLSRRLVLKGHSPEAAAAALVRCEGLGLVDDAKFTLHYVETRSARGRGPLRLRRDLAMLGVSRLIVDRVLADTFGGDLANTPQAEALAQKRLAQLKGLSKPVQRRRVLAFLARRGFSGAVVSRMVGKMLALGC
jgi:regulatory protein